MSVNMGQVVDTTQTGNGRALDPQAARWVAGYMVAGLVGLFVIGLIFRRHREL